MNRSEISHLVKDLALKSGFDAVGICSAEPLEEERARFTEWLNMGFGGSMSYLSREPEKRLDPRKILPSAKSVIVLALNYHLDSAVIPAAPTARCRPNERPTGACTNGAKAGIQESDPRFRGGDIESASQNKKVFGRVATYARGRDYHKILERRLRTFIQSLRESIKLAFKAKYFVDAGPLLERALAKRAGIGFIGKHTLTITKQFGSWVFLSEVISDLDLEYDRPDLRDCGSCTKCIEACPTGAIVSDYQLDARKCISFLTIENRGDISPDLRSKMGNWVFGCDVCQDVCPLNFHAKPASEDDFIQDGGGPTAAQPSGGVWLDLEEVLRIRDDEAFYAKFSGTPLTRPKREGLLRNAAMAAGNSGSPEFLPILSAALNEDSSELVKESCAWALGEITRQFVAPAKAGAQ